MSESPEGISPDGILARKVPRPEKFRGLKNWSGQKIGEVKKLERSKKGKREYVEIDVSGAAWDLLEALPDVEARNRWHSDRLQKVHQELRRQRKRERVARIKPFRPWKRTGLFDSVRAVMGPDWLGRPEIARLAHVDDAQKLNFVLNYLWRRGEIEKMLNPDRAETEFERSRVFGRRACKYVWRKKETPDDRSGV